MRKIGVETAVGFFVLAGFAAFAFVAIKLGEAQLTERGLYTLTARFDSVSGLKLGAPVELAGVRVGTVKEIAVDEKRFEAVVRFAVEDRLRLPEDTAASIRTSGIIGDKFIKLTPGGAEENLKSGGEVEHTESAIILEELLGKYIYQNSEKK
jgi:phospholipid/cholesterol/gamma-HCH transport system substrate-binding protein